MKKFLFNYVVPYLLYALFYVHCKTIREKNRNPGKEDYFNHLDGPYILTLWHGRIYYLFHHFRNRPDLHLLVSPSADGDLLANMARLLGYSVIRGSTYKNPIASTRKLIKVLRNNGHIIVVADGSRGPCCQAQAGTLQIARATGAPVIPMTYEAERKFQLPTWDRHVIPFPFTTCTVNFGDPFFVPRKAEENQIEGFRQTMEDALLNLTREADPTQK